MSSLTRGAQPWTVSGGLDTGKERKVDTGGGTGRGLASDAITWSGGKTGVGEGCLANAFTGSFIPSVLLKVKKDNIY